MLCNLNPKVDSPPYATTVAGAAALQCYQEDPVHQPWGLRCELFCEFQYVETWQQYNYIKFCFDC